MSFLPNIDPNIVYKYARIPLSSAQILSLGTPLVLVPAPGVGKALILREMDIKYTFVSAAYATAATMNIKCSTTTIASNTGLLASLVSDLKQLGISSQIPLYDNAGITLSAALNPTLGDGTMVFYVTYQEITL